MPPAIIAVAVSLAAQAAAYATIITATTALIITIGASVAAALLTKAPSFGGYTTSQERKQVLRSSTAPCVTIYGACVVSGLLFFAEEQAGDSEKEWLHLAIAIANHPVQSVDNIWLGDDLIGSYGSNVTYTIHSDRTISDPFMLANCASWKDDMIGKGITWARISLKFDPDKFPAGLPNIKFEVKGKKVYDPRNQSVAWSDNAALCILDYYRSHLQVPDTDINMDQFIQAANISDQLLDDGGGTRRRYTINGTFDADEEQASVLDELHKSCAGEPTYMAGKHGMLAGAYYGPATMDLHSHQIISDVKLTPEAAYGDKLNIVTGTFLDPLQQYSETDYPAVSVQQYIDADGAEFSDDLKLRFVNNVFQAQQLAQIKINRTRIGRMLTFTTNLSGYSYRPGYYVNLYIPELGISNVEHRIIDWSIDANEGVKLTLRQETAAVWGDAIGKPIERPDITDFPTAEVAQPVNLTYTVQSIGEVVQGVLSWKNVGAVSYNIIFIRQNGTTIQTLQTTGESINLTGLVRGSYTASVVAVNAMGVRSQEAFITIEIRAPATPTGCEIVQGVLTLLLRPISTDPISVSTQFDFWTSGETRLTDTSDFTVTHMASRKGIATVWSANNLKLHHTYYWYIRAINAFGASSFLEVAAYCDSDMTDVINLVDSEIQNSDAYKLVQAGIDTNIEGIMQNALAHNGNVDRQFEQLGTVSAQILTVKSTVVDLNSAFAQQTSLVNAKFNNIDASILQQQTAISNNTQAISNLDTYVQASVGPTGVVTNNLNSLNGSVNSLTSAVNQKLNAEITSDGTAKASYVLNLGIIRNGVKYNTGFGMSIESSGSTYKSTTVFKSDNVGFYASDPNNYKLLLGIYNGQVFINDGMIRSASIDNTKIGNYIQSDTWDGTGNVGWHINKNGYANFQNGTFRGTVYAANGEFTGKITATSGSFKGTVEATSFVGDVANTGIGADTVVTGSGVASKTITFTDSAVNQINKSAILEALVYLSASVNTTAGITLNINGNVRGLGTIAVPSGTFGVWITVRHAATGIGSTTVTGVITVTGKNLVSKAILAPTLTITRGNGSFS